MIKGNEFMKKVDGLLGQEKELIVLKGKLFAPQKASTKEGNETYYTFRLKTLKKSSNDEYGQSFNTYHCVMPTDVSKNYSEQDIQALKNNEVLCLCTFNASVKTLPNSGAVVNNITIFVNDVMLVRSIDSNMVVHKAINL